jgi:hypothetical protein
LWRIDLFLPLLFFPFFLFDRHLMNGGELYTRRTLGLRMDFGRWSRCFSFSNWLSLGDWPVGPAMVLFDFPSLMDEMECYFLFGPWSICDGLVQDPVPMEWDGGWFENISCLPLMAGGFVQDSLPGAWDGV